ncbi:MAG: hypothetical protein IT321_07100 [Anaerolineae bacterium]|nr:hypothetical protein [Anaerolineae bacterium]
MLKKIILLGIFLFALTSVALMQETPTPTPAILGAVNAVTPTPRPPKSPDPRPAICSAPYQEGWQRHQVQGGETLASFMTGITNLSVTQAAALNCIDDPNALPIGSFVWLPPEPETSTTPPTCPQLVRAEGEVGCVNASSGIQGAQQLFQNGMMLWREDTGDIWVISNDETVVHVYEDTYVEGEPDPTATPPATFFAPVRGFGKVWAEMGGENSALGWATAPESQVSLTVQPAGRVSYTEYIQLPDGEVYAATLLPDTSEGWWVPLALS